MPSENEASDFGALLAGGLVGLGAGLFAASAIQTSNEKRRAEFRNQLTHALAERGVLLLSATFGRGQGNAPFWRMTLRDAVGQLWSVRVGLPEGVPPYSDEARSAVVASLEAA